MATPKEINIATKESIDLLLSDGIGPDAYMEPPKTIEDLQAKGLLDQDGNATSKGFLFTVLQEAGAIDERGVLTDKARAYTVSPRDLQSPDNLWAFKQQWKDGILDGADQTFTETAGAVADFGKDAVTGIATRAWQEAQTLFHQSKTWKGFFGMEDNRPEKLKREMEATGLGLAEGATQAAAQTGTTAFVASAWLGDKIHDTLGTGLEDEAEEMLWTARQKQWSLNQDIQALEAGETAEAVLGMADAVETAAQAKEQLGEEEFQNKYGKALAAGQLFGSPENIATMLVSGGAATAPTLATRWGLRAQNALGKVAQLDAKIAAAEVALAKANNVISKQAVWAAKPETAALAGRLAADAQAAIPRLSDDLAKLTAQRTALATKIPEAAAQAFQKTIELGRQVKAAPANIMGGTLERIGSTMQRIDSGIAEGLKSRGLDQLYTFGVGAASMAGLGGNPVFGAIAAGAGFLKMGGRIEQFGKLSKYVGKEMMKARGQVPFWKRVANHTQPGTLNSALAHAFNYADLAGVSSDVLRRGLRGVKAAAPMDLAFEWLAEGADMDRKTIQQSLAESLVLGGSTAALGGIFMGTKKRMRELAIGDEISFRESLVDPDQKALFQYLPPAARRAIGTYSMANPNLKFDFRDMGGSNYDPASNTVSINVASSNPLKALVAHEVLHHVTIKNQMEPGIAALFLGDTQGNTTGGLLRSKDGTLDPNFKAFVDTYNNRMAQAGMESPSMETLAVEYFIEQHADQYADMAESGELGAMASRTALGNKMRDIVNAILPKAPVLKDLHFKMGGQMDANGAMVMGNGLLAEGIRQLPAAQRMFRDMNRRSAGNAEGQFTPLGTRKKDDGVPLTLDPTNPVDLGMLHPILDIGPDGKAKPIDKATDLARSQAGLALLEGLRNKQKKNRMPEQGEMHIAPDGSVKGQWLDTETLKNIINQGKFNREQAQILTAINNLLKSGEGGRMVVINFPATAVTRRGKKVYRPQAAALRDAVPVALTVTKDGNIRVGLMSVTQLTQNIQKRAQSKRGKSLYGGNIGAITEDVREMMKAHKAGVDSIGYFTEKYGAVEAETRKKFINTLFGLMNKSEQAVLNPMLLEDGVKSDSNVYRTYRLDRISKAVPLDPTQYKPMTFVYEAAKTVKMPQARMMPEPVGMIPGSRVTGVNVPASIADKQSMVSLGLLAPHLSGDPKAAKRAGAYIQTVARSVTDAVGLRDLATDITNETDAKTVLDAVVQRLADNLETLYNAIPEDLRTQWKEWYVIANDWSSVRASRLADSHRDVVAGMIARLSPGKDWFHNITMVDHLIDTINADPILTQAHTNHLVDREIYAWRQTTAGRKASRQKETALRKRAAASMDQILSKHYGRKFSHILIEDAPAAARFARAYSEMVLDQRVKDHADKVVTNADGSAQKLSWQSFSNISKALEIYQYPSRNRISELLGDDHKIRSFYNNIVDPFDTEFLDVTIDTHAVAAALLAPLSQKAPEVSAAFGGTVSPEDMAAFGIRNQTGKNKADSGLSGNYAIYADAYRVAAERLGVLPREIQSITWEGIRAFYPGPLKRDAGIVSQIRGLLNSTNETKIQQIDRIRNQWTLDHPDLSRANLLPLSGSSPQSTKTPKSKSSQKGQNLSSAKTSPTTRSGQNISGTTRADAIAEQIVSLSSEAAPRRMMPEPLDASGKNTGMDQQYLQAVESGDMETAQRMVDEAANAAGYTLKAFHGTDSSQIGAFDIKRAGTRTDDIASKYGFWATDQSDIAASYGENVMSVFLRLKNKTIVDMQGAYHENVKPKMVRIIKRAIKDGDDGVIFENLEDPGIADWDVKYAADTYVVFDPSNIKSADPVTYDAEGNVIPLSERFNPQSNDIRYMPEGEPVKGQ